MKQEIPKAEIVIGVCTKDCEGTIQGVLEKVDKGLSEFYPRKKSLIVVSDLSSDSTEERVREVKTRNRVFFTRQDGGPGKGNGVRTVFRTAESAGAKVIALVDGDLTSIMPKWIKALVEPVLEGYDLAVPYYERHKYDAVITNHVIYPFVTSMYGTEIRQPIGGEFGLSMKFAGKLLRHPRFPEGFGIDIFLTTSALADGMKVAETALGVKSHASTESYKDFEKSLVPMFNQVVGTLFDLTMYNLDKLRDVTSVRNVKRFNEVSGGLVSESVVDRKVLFSMFQRDLDKVLKTDILSDETKDDLVDIITGSVGRKISAGTWVRSALDMARYFYGRMTMNARVMRSDILSEETKRRIRESVYGEKGQIISVDTWTDAVFDAFRKYKKSGDKDAKNKEDVIDVIRAVWVGRFSSFVRQTRFMDTRDAECMIKGQVSVFNEKKARIIRDL